MPTRSAKKINSHRWALQAFAPQLDPRVVILIDVGTTPEKGSIYELWKAFDVRLACPSRRMALRLTASPSPSRRSSTRTSEAPVARSSR